MEQRTLGSSDLLVSVVGMGCNNFSRPGTATETQEGSSAVIRAAIDAGVTFFDGADVYGGEPGRSEEFLGVALRDGYRDKVVLATKFGHRQLQIPGYDEYGAKGGERYVRHAVEESLRRLRTDRIDLLQMHTPDEGTPIAETLAALTRLVAEGKVRCVGSSNFSPDQLEEADRVAREEGFVRFVTAQDQYSLLHRDAEAGVLPAARRLALGFLPYLPLKSGLLSGKYSRSGGEGRLTQRPEQLEDVDWDKLDAYRALCEEAGLTMVQASIGWLLAQDPVSCVIAGATRVEQVEQNVAAGDVRLPDSLVDRIGELFE
ncbi:aldo/keto reductase [Nigerium massiliense]|uniref:aldo/keto reductase n=1 Tax=Nigerium massiliense TaxID=1522317 RepID=UPI00058C7A12|nr:aldo/keto reductase [Nigerium massiliense]